MSLMKGEGGALGPNSIYDLHGRSRGHRGHVQKPQIKEGKQRRFISWKPRKAFKEESLLMSTGTHSRPMHVRTAVFPGACRGWARSGGQQMRSTVFSS